MKKNFIFSALLILITISSAALTNTVSAKTTASCPSEQITNTNTLETSEHVVINEVYGGSETGGIYNADFIELYNPSASTADVSDYPVECLAYCAAD